VKEVIGGFEVGTVCSIAC